MTTDESKSTQNERKSTGSAFTEHQIARFGTRLKQVMGDDSFRSFAAKCSLSDAVIRDYVRGKTFPSLDRLWQIAAATGADVNWLATGEEGEAAVIQAVPDTVDKEDKRFKDEFALIPGYRIQVSAGHGSLNGDDQPPVRHLAFRRKWLSWRGFSEKDLVIVWAKGDSMYPTINNNDSLVINTARQVPKDGHMYVFRQDEALMVKRVQQRLDGWVLLSDNKMYPDMVVPKDEQHNFQVIGQVVHIAKDVGD